MAEGDAVKVCVRVRPLIQRENGEQTSLHWKAENASISQVDGTKSFNFDRVFHSHETTNQVYQEIAVPIIRSAAQGYNGTIFAYGQTASGKTYTMMGTEKSLGIIPQAVQEIFSIIHEVPGREFLLRVSYMEIYNETVTDLLCDDRKKKPLEIREDINRNVYVADLTEELVVVPEQVLTWIKKGEKNRHYGETKMNERSSRSHTIFRMIVESRDRTDSGNGENCEGAVMVSHLNLVDLAGSERASQTGAEGLRLKEGCNINRSLFILGQVIKKLSDGQAGGFINYRDSKLTRILQNSLGGNAKTVIICTVTPVSFDETLSTLQFASTAKHMRNTPHVNEVLDDQALLKRYRKEIMDLKKQLEDLEVSSEVRTQAMAKEEHLQLLAEIKLLQKEREDRIWNLTHIVVNSSQASNKDEKEKRKRRVTWAAGNIQKSFSSVSDLSISSTITPNFIKKAKMSNLSPLTEIDDSFCTEIFDLEESSNVLDDVAPESDFRNVNQNIRRDNASLCQSMIDFTFEGRLCNRYQCQELSLQKSKEIEQKTTELENHLKKLISENEAEAEIRESLKKDIINLQTQLQLKEEEKNEIVKNFEQRVKDLEDQLQTKIETNEMSNELGEKYTTDDQKQLENGVLRTDVNVLPGTAHRTDDGDQNKPIDKVPCALPDDWIEHRRMLEIKIMDLEQIIETSKLAHCNKNDTQKYSEQDLMESIQICEVLMNENGNAVEELAVMRNSFDSIVLENESLKREIADLENQLREKEATNEFEVLERESLKEHETQLTHEIVNLKNLIGNAEVYNQDLEAQLESKSKLLKEQEKQLVELKKNADDLQKKVRNMELSVSMGDGERLCEEVFQMRQSVSDAERVTLDAKRESAFLRSENLQLKEKMEEFSIRYEQMEKEISIYEKQIETEKTKYKQMQTDLQKELQYAFNEINQLNGLMVGKVPKDLLLRVELEKKIGDCTKQLEKAMEEKNDLEKEVTYLSEFKSLPSEVVRLKNEMHDTTEELNAVKTEREQSVIVLSSLETRLQEQSKQIELLTEDLTQAQAKLQNAEEQYSELKQLHDFLQEKSTLTTEELMHRQAQCDSLLKEVEQLKGLVVTLEEKLATKIQELEEAITVKEQLLLEQELAQEKQMGVSDVEQLCEQLKITKTALFTMEEERNQVNLQLQALQEELTRLNKEREEMQKSVEEMDKMKEQVCNLSSLVEDLQQEASKLAQVQKEKEQLEECIQQCHHEKDQLQDCVKEMQCSLDIMQLEKLEVDQKLKELQDELKVIVQERNELQHTWEDLKTERDNLKQDLNENIELSIQTQEELRAKQDELKQQAHIVNDLKKQIAEYDMSTSLQAENKDNVDEKILLQENLQENKRLYQKLEDERKALEKDCEGLKSEMEHLQECRKATELTLEKLNEEKTDLTHKLCTAEEQLRFVSHERDTIKEMQESFRDERDKLLEEVQKNVKKIKQLTEEVNMYSERNTLHEEDGKVQHLHQKILAAVKEKEELQEILETVRAERDQLKLDLQENIEMSIETQEELRCALDELKKKKQLLDAMGDKELDNFLMPREDLEHKICQLEEQLNTMTSEKDKLLHELNIMTGEKQELEDLVSSFTVDRDADINETKNNLQEELQSPLQEVKQDCEKYAAQLEEERTINNNLYSQIEEKNKTIEEQESQLKNISENLCEADSKYTRLMESLELVTREKDQLLQTLESTAANATVPNESNAYKQVTETTHQSLQTSLVISMESDADESILTSATRIEDKESEQNLNESVNQLKKQLYFVSQEKEELQGLIDHLKLENQQLMIMTDQLKNTEKEVMLSLQNQLNSSYEALVNEVETLKDELNVTETNLELKEREAVELKQTDYKIGSNTIEGSEEINNFLEPSTSHAGSERSPYAYYPEIKVLEENLQVTQALLEAIQGEKLKLENKLHTLQEEVYCLKDELQQKHARTEQLTDEHKQVHYELTSKMDALTETMKHSECLLEALQQEKLEAQEKLLDLQQQIQTLTQERDELKNTQERIVTESHELNEDLKETVSMFTETKTEWRMQDELKCQTELMDDFKIQDSSMPTEIEQSLEEKVLHLQKELEQKTAEEKQLINKHEEAQHELKSMVDELTETIKHHQSVLEALQGEKLEAQQTLLDLQQEMQTLKEERDALKNTQERLMAESDQLKVQHDLQSKVDALMETMKHSERLLEALQGEKLEAHQKLLDLQQQMETVTQDRDELKNTQKGLMSESDHLKEELKDSVSKYTETQDELKKTQEELLCQKQLIDNLKSQNSLRPSEEVVQSLEEKVLHLENELEQKAAEDQHMKDQYEQAQHELKSKMNALMETLKHSESVLETLQEEKLEAQQKLLDLQQQMQTATQEKDEFQSTKEKLREESDQLKEDLKDKISMYLKIEDELKSTQNELKYQKDLLDDLRVQVSSRPTTEIVQSLKDKILHLRNELQQKEAEEQELLDKNEKAQNELRLKVDELTETMKHSQSVLEVVQGEKLEAQQKLFDLQEQVGTVTQERDELHNKQERVIAESNQLKEDLKENISMSIEIQDELRSAHEESQKQKLREQDLNNQISLLEQKLSSQEKEMLHIGTSLKETISANEVLTQCKEQLASELEQLNQSLKDKAVALEQLESEKMEVAKKLLNITEDMRTISEERDQLKHLKDTMHNEAKSLHDELQQLQHQYDLLSDEQKRGNAKLEDMINENKHLKENISVSDASIEKLEAEKVLLEKHIQEYEMKVASLHQEREQHQQLLERIRGEKDNIYMDLQAQENISKQLREELNHCQTELQSVKQQKNAINETLEKTSQLDDQTKSLQQKLKNVNQELLAEKMKNCDLCEKVGLMEKEIQVLRSLQDESLQEDDLADRMEFLENKNEELKELMGKVSEIYSDHNNLVNNLSGELQNNIESQKQSMCIIKESLSSTMSRAFGNLQTENIKLNSQLQTLLNKLKVVCRNAEVKDEYYSLIKDFEKDLCAEQKKLDELQYLEEHGTKCSGAALEELKICELEYLNKLIFTKMELMKRVEGDFSDMQVTFKSMASELQKEVTCKQEFLLWLEDFKTLHLDAAKLNEGVQKENKRISAVVLNLTKNLKAVAQSKIKNYMTTYVNQLDTDLRETKSKSKEQLASMKHLPASGNTSALEEENAALLTKLRSVESELKKTKSRICNLENELESAKARIQQKEEKVALLQNQLLSRTAETELAKVQVKLTEKENALHTVLEEVKSLQEKVAQGARPYKEDIDNLKTQLVKIEMEKMKLSKSMDAEIESLKARLEDKTESVRKLREQLRKTQQDHDSTVIVEKDHSSCSKLPLTCGGGSGIVQSTAMLVLQSEKASLERELAQYKRKCERFSRNMSHLEDELTKWKDKATRAQSSPSKSEIHKEHAVSPTRCVPYLQSHRAVSPSKGELHKRCPGTNMAELHRKHPASPSKAELLRKCPSSPNKVEMFRKRPGSPSKAETKRQCGLSPRKTDIPLLSTLTASPIKAKDLQEHIDSPKSTFFDSRSRSLPVHYPTQFFDNSSLGTFSESRPSETTEPNEEENWWYAPNKAENAPGCKTS